MPHKPFRLCIQAVQLAPSNVKAQYRLAQAYLHLEQYQQCQDACKAALQTKSGVTQLQRLSQLAESMMRGCFIKGREVEVNSAVTTAHQAGIQQVGQQTVIFTDYKVADPSKQARLFTDLFQVLLLTQAPVWLLIALMTA